MRPNIIMAATAAAVLSVPLDAQAREFFLVKDRSEFIELIEGRDLTRFGVRLNVTPDGQITGSAFGFTVTGTWDWQGNYFCRDMSYGSGNALGYNCQTVYRDGDMLRFIADRGDGDHADLRLR
ncbi:hypothetical protein [Roseicitreum antarcticum]|uniref:Dihydrodipicolinate reductase n=1 Tax=Roseicitreum antarcticum TaxID=564137 RepID=A0A1H2RQS1_9RHOB|nr:hypothetical protein [Roseicitreum antarcticum]SDW21761.1 hypothetical protein SAMN04488238_101393 [Roseicitreum antarcticum]